MRRAPWLAAILVLAACLRVAHVLTRTVLRRAALPMATPVRTLDAIHLATALMVRERTDDAVVFLTHDGRLSVAARALGFAIGGAH